MEFSLSRGSAVIGFVCACLTLLIYVWNYNGPFDSHLPLSRHDGGSGELSSSSSSSKPYQAPASFSYARQNDGRFYGNASSEDDASTDSSSMPDGTFADRSDESSGVFYHTQTWLEKEEAEIQYDIDSRDMRDHGISFMTREQLKAYNASTFLQMDPPTYLPHYRSPCWRQEGSKGGVYIQCLPSVFLAGFPKCGTTELFRTLLAHPAIAYGNSKEPHYWTRQLFNDMDFADYAKAFRKSSRQITRCEREKGRCFHPVLAVDGSASTIWDNSIWQLLDNQTKIDGRIRVKVPHILKHLIPDLKVIVIMRDPVDRLYSDYLYFHSSHPKSPELFHEDVVQSLEIFRTCIRTTSLRDCAYTKRNTKVRLNVGLYYVFLREWTDVISRERLHALRLEDFSEERDSQMDGITDFLRIGRLGNYIDNDGRSNSGRLATKKLGPMLPSTRLLLQDFYSTTNHQLASLLGDKKYTWGY